MARRDSTSIAASDALSSVERVPPSAQSRAESKRGDAKQSRGSRETGVRGRKSKPAIQSPNTETPAQKTETPNQNTETQPTTGPNGYPVHSTSKLGELFDLNRATVAQRLKEHKIKPVDVGPRKADYELTPQVEELLSDGATDPEFKAAQRRIAIANARIKEKEADEAEKRSIPRDEMFEEVSAILKSLHQQFVLQLPRANSARYFKFKSRAELEAALKNDNAKPFQQLRSNYNEIVAQRSEVRGQRSVNERPADRESQGRRSASDRHHQSSRDSSSQRRRNKTPQSRTGRAPIDGDPRGHNSRRRQDKTASQAVKSDSDAGARDSSSDSSSGGRK